MNLPAPDRSAQRGAALIVALVVVSMVAVLAVSLSSDFLLMFRRVENQLHSEQAYAYLLGAEGVARAALIRDEKMGNGNTSDNLFEEWAKPQKFPTDYGWVAGQLEDMEGRFNLNSLAAAPATPGQSPNPANPLVRTEPQRILKRLLQSLPLSEPLAADQADALVDAITDWIDPDDTVSGLAGAESQYYAGVDPARLPPNHKLASPSELMWVKGMTPQIYRLLRPLVTVWPADGSLLNVNTAPPQVLAGINGKNIEEPLRPNEVEKLVAERNSHHVLTVDTINVAIGGAEIEPSAYRFDQQSEYFELTAQTEFQGRRFMLRSVLHRDDKSVRVVSRTLGEW